MFRTKTKRAAGGTSVAQRKRKEIDEDEDEDDGADAVAAPAAVAVDDSADEVAAEDALLARMRERNKARRHARPTASTGGASSASTTSANAANGRSQIPTSIGGALSFEAEAESSTRASKRRIRPNLLVGGDQALPSDAADDDIDTGVAAGANAYSQAALAALRKQQNVLLSGERHEASKDGEDMDELEGATVVVTEEDDDVPMAIDDNDNNVNPAEEEPDEADAFIPLDSQRLQSRKKRNRVTFGVPAAAPRPSQATEEVVDDDSNDDDEEERRWEADVMRRGGLRSINRTDASSGGAGSASASASASSAGADKPLHAYPTHRRILTSTLPDVLAKLQRSLDTATVETGRTERELARIAAETALIQDRVGQQQTQLRVASDEFEYFQSIEDFVESLSFCLRAKEREIAANEREVVALRVTNIRSLRDKDTQQAQMITDALKAADVITEAGGANAGLQLFSTVVDSDRADTAAGVDSATSEKLARGFVDRTPAIPQPPAASGFDVFADAIDALSSLASVHARFEAWRTRFPDVYARCYCDLALETLYAPYVQAELLFWDPLSVAGAAAGPPWSFASHFDWVRVLQPQSSPTDDDNDDSRHRIVAALVRDAVLAKTLTATAQYFDPFSALHTQSLCVVLEEVGKRPLCAAVCAAMTSRVVAEAAAQFVAAAKLVPLVSLVDETSALAATFAAYELGRFNALLDNALTLFVALPRDAAADSAQTAGFRCVMQLLHQLLAYLSHCQRAQQTRLVARAVQTAAQLTASPFLQQRLASSSQERELQHLLALFAPFCTVQS